MDRLAQLAAAAMEQAGGGAMLAITSIAGGNKNIRRAACGASEAATNHLIRNIALDLGPKSPPPFAARFPSCAGRSATSASRCPAKA